MICRPSQETMFVHIFTSAYFGQISHKFSVDNTTIIKDSFFLNKKAEERFMLNADTKENLDKAIKIISDLIQEYCIETNRNHNKKCKYSRVPPSPLSMLII